jgi:diguanylate cyclase (GGDEF)-like protein/PAS domain S-box-containing protein
MGWIARCLSLTRLLVPGCCSALCCANEPSSVLRNPRFENIGTEQGLPQDTVDSMVQDHEGFMWFGTQAGLVRYDGYRFNVFRGRPGDADALQDNFVTTIFEDRQNRLWIGTRGGLYRLDADRIRFEALDPHEPAARGHGNRDIQAIAAPPAGTTGSDDAIWVGTADGLERIDANTGTFQVWHHVAGDAASLGSDNVHAFSWDDKGRLWIGTSAGVDRLTPASGRFEHFQVATTADNAASRNFAQALRWLNPNTLWIGTKEGVAIWSISPEMSTVSPLPDPPDIPHNQILAFDQDQSGNVWIGTLNDGVFRFDPTNQRAIQYRHRAQDPNSLAEDRVASILHDRSGTIWLGTWNGGISRLDLASGGFERYINIAGDPDTLNNNLVYGISGDGHGGLWFATLRGGLDHFDPTSRRMRHYQHDPADPHSLPDNWISDAQTDSTGRLWVATNRGFGSMDPDNGRFLSIHPDASTTELSEANCILIDRGGIVWFGTEGGLHRYDPANSTLTTFVHDSQRADSLAQGRITVLIQDSKGALWAGATTGLDRMDMPSGSFAHFRHDPTRAESLSHDRISSLFEDSAGKLWIGTASGLNRMEVAANGTVLFHAYTRRDGLADDTIGAIESDAKGRIWFSTTGGISRLDPANGKVRNYTARDGLTTGSFYVHSGYTAPDGTIYFGGQKGVVSFQPDAVSDNVVAPTVAITELRVHGKTVGALTPSKGVEFQGAIEQTRELRLSHEVPEFTLEFAALHFADPSRNRFAHQLEGFDRDWIETDASQRSATYTNLDPGRYTFRVKASNKDGIWNTTGATLTITVLPPWWATWWFRVLSAGLMLGAVFLLYRQRVSGLTRQRTLLAEEVRVRTAEVVQQKEDIEQANSTLSVLGEIGRQITATLDESAILRTLDHHVRALLDAPMFGIYLMDADAQGLTSAHIVEEGQQLAGDHIELSSMTRIGARCVRERREIVVDLAPDAENPSHVRGTLQTLSALFAPLVIGERVLGMMTIQSGRQHAYGERELVVFRTLCSYGAIALDNAAAYRSLAETDAALQRTLREQHLIFDNVAAAVFFVKGRLIYRCNRAMEEMLGYEHGQLVGQSTEVYHPNHESWEAQGRQVYPLISAGEVAEGEWEIMRKNGERFWVAFRGRALDPRDLSQGSIWVAHDITERKRAEAALKLALQEQQIIFDNIAGSIVIAKEGLIHRCNRGFEKMLGFLPGEAIGRPVEVGYLSADDWKSFAKRIAPDILAGKVVTGEGEYRRTDGEHRWMLYQGKAIDPGDMAQGTIWFGQDITERKHSETQLIEAKQRLERGLAEVEQMNSQVTLLGELTGFLQACPSASDAYACVGEFGPRLFPLSTGALYLAEDNGGSWVAHGSWGNLPSGGAELTASFQSNECWSLRRSRAYRVDDPASTLACPHVAVGSGRHPYVCVPLTAQGKTFGLLHVVHANTVESDEAERRHGLAVSMAEQIALAISNLQLREALLQQSIRDPLTGLYNRRHMQEALFREIGRSRRTESTLALMMIDVDHFKRFNDTFGHNAGDIVLQQVARTIEAQVRRGDVACRFGGEEFAVLLPSATLDLALKLANGVLEGVRALLLNHDGRALERITASLGVALFPTHAHTPEALIEAADQALYQAKDAGRNRVVTFAS